VGALNVFVEVCVMAKLRGLAASALSVGALLGTTFATTEARAHFDQLDGTHMSRSGGGLDQIKAAPCGIAGSTRGTNVYTYKPGSTITISVDEYIPHPGYYRIAFDNDGDDGFVTPASISGEHGNCDGDPKCGPGMEDFCNNDTVLLDNLDAHASMFGASWTWSVTLPNVECDNCTLQIIQVMTDLDVHGVAYPADDIYYQCIDLVLSNEATNELGTPAENNGMDCTTDDVPMGGAGGGDGGVAGEGGMGGAGGMTGGAGGMTGGAGGAGGMTGGAGGVTGGAGGAAGAAAGVSGGGVGGMGGAGGMNGGAAAPPAPAPAEESSCSAGHGGSASGALGPLLLALALLFTRKRR
jgi:hypothetical protein